MSANLTIAKDVKTGKYLHIDEVERSLSYGFVCNCGNSLTAVKSIARKKDWHFRHSAAADIEKCRGSILHSYAVQIIREHAEIIVADKLKIYYKLKGTEVWLDNLYRSDITVSYQNEDIHFEVFVTHDLSTPKATFYKDRKIKCVRIDLSNRELLMASPEKIKDEVLNQHYNKEFIFWSNADEKKNSHSLSIIIAFLSFLGLIWLYRKLRR